MPDADLNRWPPEAIKEVEHLWPYLLGGWLLGMVVAALVAVLVARRAGAGGSPAGWARGAMPWIVFVTLVSLLPSVREWVLSASVLGLAAGWLALALITAKWSGSMNAWIATRWQSVLKLSAARFAIGGWLFCAAFYVLVGYLEFGWIPVLQDTQAHLFHAHVLLEGSTYAATPPFGEFYLAELMIQDGGRWYSQYPIGHIVPLAIGLFFGAPWIVNPLLGATSGWLIYRTTADRFGEARGRLAWLLFVASPFTMVMSAEYLGHASGGVAFLLQLFAISRFLGHPSDPPERPRNALVWGTVFGFGAGWLLATRPLTALAVLGVFGIVYALWAPSAGWRRLLPFLTAGALASTLWVVPQLLFNASTNGDPFLFGYEVLFPEMRWGFVDSQLGAHTPFRGVEFFLRFLNGENLYLLGLPLPGLLVVMVGLTSEADWWKRLVVTLYVAVVVTYCGYFYSDLTFGPRFTYEVSLALFGLAALGLPLLVARVDRWLTHLRKRPVSSLPALIIIYAVGFAPNQMAFYHRAYNLDDGVVAQAERELDGPSLVFVESPYMRAFFAVRPSLDQEILFARDRGEDNHLLACHEDERTAYVELDGQLVLFEPECER